ncbi:uncharacterized protein LOC752492 isoform X2 [Strongylocentrotus purpuratus]|uniref:DUF6589 domain-containing protein n=1 Tax=Strongylocentrotus purpuratus TaxID=7668 RepID=A0A7M7NJX0_STRPU|nr:uncharacterized protein LOC752492 isoform X2 [Strongylocentrotus purpuratus]
MSVHFCSDCETQGQARASNTCSGCIFSGSIYQYFDAIMDGHCCNCGAELRTDLKRPTLNAIIRGRGVSSVDGLKSMGIVVSPGKERKYRICKICSQLIGKISQSKTEIEESHSSLQNISDGSTYLGQKIKRCLSPPASPPQKRRNLTQTPQQNTQETQTEPMAETPGDPPKKRIFERLSRLGLCTNIGTTTNCIDTLRGEFDTTIHHQKLQIADIKRRSTRAKKRLVPAEEWEDEGGWEEVQETPEEVTPLVSSPVDEGPHNIDALQPDPDSSTFNCANIDDTTTTTFGFTLTFDNVSLWPSRTPFYSGQLNLVRSHAAIDRVSCFNLSDEAPSLKELSNISQDIFIPTTEDNDMLRYEYEVMIERILSKHIPCFKDIDVTEHIPHPYQAETKKKSVMVPLGVLQKDVTNVSDMIDVLTHLHKHVPGHESPIPVILYGDQPSCERVRDAIGVRSNEDTPWNRLGGLLPSIQESHKCLLFLEDTYKLLFDAKSVKSCGSLSFIKSRYKHTHVTPKVSYCFNYATSMLRFATEAHVVAAACEYMGISKPSDPPKIYPRIPRPSQYISVKYVNLYWTNLSIPTSLVILPRKTRKS